MNIEHSIWFSGGVCLDLSRMSAFRLDPRDGITGVLIDGFFFHLFDDDLQTLKNWLKHEGFL